MNNNLSMIHPTRARISLRAFHHNMNVVRSCVGKKVKILAVVKANAYGHGMNRLAMEAIRMGADYLGVARVHEGLFLRECGIEKSILVFEVIPERFLQAALKNDLLFTVSSIEGARKISAGATKWRMKARVHIKLDTGMGRLGLDPRTAVANVEKIAGMGRIDVEGIYSHFATSDEPEKRFAREQLRKFTGLVEDIQRKGIEIPLMHMANSGGIIAFPESHFDMVRPGIMLYGYTPRYKMRSKWHLVPVMSLLSEVSHIKRISKGTSISYGRRYHASRETCIATVPIGYADGMPRILTNNVEVLIRGMRFPAVGTICMDHLMVDVGTEGAVSVGDEVVLIGKSGREQITAWDLALRLQSIPYEVTCMVSARVPREYVL